MGSQIVFHTTQWLSGIMPSRWNTGENYRKSRSGNWQAVGQMCRDFAVCHKVETGSETHLVACLLDVWGSFTICKEAQVDAYHSSSCIA